MQCKCLSLDLILSCIHSQDAELKKKITQQHSLLTCFHHQLVDNQTHSFQVLCSFALLISS